MGGGVSTLNLGGGGGGGGVGCVWNIFFFQCRHYIFPLI